MNSNLQWHLSPGWVTKDNFLQSQQRQGAPDIWDITTKKSVALSFAKS